MIIAVDFDGTIVLDAYPKIGVLYPYADKVMQDWKKQGHRIIINTCRAGKTFTEMVDFLNYHGIPYDTINENLPERTAKYGSDTRKISADVYIDDKSLFCNRIDWQDIQIRVRMKMEKQNTHQIKLEF